MGKRSTGLKRRENRTEAAVRMAGIPTGSDMGFPVIGVGASAGGLEALTQFLSKVPVNSGMAIVVVQHLDPTREGIMPELLQRGTQMNVSQVKDRTKVQPGCVYVIPPNRDMSILRGAARTGNREHGSGRDGRGPRSWLC